MSLCALALSLGLMLLPSEPTQPNKPVPRKEAFLGMHFDLHPQKGDTELGADLDEANLRELLRRVRPDYVQYDCKGHAGYTGYPTKVGWASPGIVRDSLALWRKVTADQGVGLFVHYSGVWDTVAIEHHPEWARVDAAGNRDPNNTSTFGPYVDELLIPQLTEVLTAYKLDGAWVDGDCWAAQLDYSPAAMAAWKSETGRDDAPRKRSDPGWFEWKQFHRRLFERYVAHWVDAVHRAVPGVQLTSNWMYSTHAPKKPEVNLDFLSGDYSPTLSVDRARVEARYLAGNGLPWDLMAWGFNWTDGIGHTLKTPAMLEQEAAVVLMQGGGFQTYYQPTRRGYIVPQIIETQEAVAKFCRARQAVSHKSASVPQVALMLSSETQFDRSDVVFTPWGCTSELEGALHGLLENGYSVDILAEHALLPQIAKYPMVVVADAYRITEPTRRALLAYVRNGGSLLVLGAACAANFREAIGADFEGENQETTAELACPGGLVPIAGAWQTVRPKTAKPVAYRYATRDTRKPGLVAATINAYGKGRMAAVFGPLAIGHFRTHHPASRSLFAALARSLFPSPAVTSDAPSFVELALRRTRDGRLAVHLLNTLEMQRSSQVLSADVVPPVGPIQVRLRCPQPKRVTWEPDGKVLKTTWRDGTLVVTVPKLEIHGAILVR
ncbi:MAG: hypothetical protein KIS66_04825 [Fimbriimonadaceae bacterium]|nr:hypothetical protein [Fimbriimonadaceae bacterium]